MPTRRFGLVPLALVAAVGAGLAGVPRPIAASQRAAPPDTVRAAHAVDSLADAERGFAALAGQMPWPDAFVRVMDDSAVLFRPRPVNGPAWARAHPVTSDPGTLEWSPAVAGVSRGGDLGFTTGPSRYRAAPGADTTSRWGAFVTVWGRRPGQPWRMLIDTGIRDSVVVLPDPRAAVVTPAMGEAACAAACDPPKRRAIWQELHAADSALGRRYFSADGFRAVADAETRVMRNFRRPLAGVQGARIVEAQGAVSRAGSSRPLGGGVAALGDLGYTYGEYERVPADTAGHPERGHYLRIWRHLGGRWRLLFDANTPLPPGV